MKTIVATAEPEVVRCSCGTEAEVISVRWETWVQLAPHNQPNRLGCLPGRLQPKVG